jgi:hypothetical protein
MELSVAAKPVILVLPCGAFHDRRRLADAGPFHGRAEMQLLAEEERDPKVPHGECEQ